MKILLICPPRTASKFMQININTWLNLRYGYSLHFANDYHIGAGECLFVSNPPNFGKLTLVENKLFYKNVDIPLNFLQELYERANILTKDNHLIVVKYMPIQFSIDDEITVLNELIPKFDMVYVFDRVDREDHKLSWCISFVLGCWSIFDQIKNKEKIDLFRKQKIDIDAVVPIYNEILTKYEKILEKIKFKDFKELLFEDIIAVKNSTEFCKLLELPTEEFLLDPFTKEFGVSKKEFLRT